MLVERTGPIEGRLRGNAGAHDAVSGIEPPFGVIDRRHDSIGVDSSLVPRPSCDRPRSECSNPVERGDFVEVRRRTTADRPSSSIPTATSGPRRAHCGVESPTRFEEGRASSPRPPIGVVVLDRRRGRRRGEAPNRRAGRAVGGWLSHGTSVDRAPWEFTEIEPSILGFGGQASDPIRRDERVG